MIGRFDSRVIESLGRGVDRMDEGEDQTRERNRDATQYIYRGDRWTMGWLCGRRCEAIRRPDGKCIRGRNGNMLVRFTSGEIVVVLGRQLRKVSAAPR